MRLYNLPLPIIKRKLVKRLLQRMVLVDEYAQQLFLPYLLSLRPEDGLLSF